MLAVVFVSEQRLLVVREVLDAGASVMRGEYEVEDGEIEDQGPLGGVIDLRVRLFAEGGQTVVEQTFELEGRGDRWLLYQHEGDQNTENGVPLPPP